MKLFLGRPKVSSNEEKFLNFCKENNIPVQKQRTGSGINHSYMAQFQMDFIDKSEEAMVKKMDEDKSFYILEVDEYGNHHYTFTPSRVGLSHEVVQLKNTKEINLNFEDEYQHQLCNVYQLNNRIKKIEPTLFEKIKSFFTRKKPEVKIVLSDEDAWNKEFGEIKECHWIVKYLKFIPYFKNQLLKVEKAKQHRSAMYKMALGH